MIVYVGPNPSPGVCEWLDANGHVAAHVTLVRRAYVWWIGQPWFDRLRFGDPADCTRGIWIEPMPGCGCALRPKTTWMRFSLSSNPSHGGDSLRESNKQWRAS